MDYILTTERLQLQPCSLEDLELLYSLWTIDRIRHFLFDDRTISWDEARSFLAASLTSFEHHDYGLWLVHGPNPCIGFAGLLDGGDVPNLIYGIHPDVWGQGYATEAAGAVLSYGLNTLALSQVNADVDEPNLASVRVLQKLGMQQIDRKIVNDRPLLYFSAVDTTIG